LGVVLRHALYGLHHGFILCGLVFLSWSGGGKILVRRSVKSPSPRTCHRCPTRLDMFMYFCAQVCVRVLVVLWRRKTLTLMHLSSLSSTVLEWKVVTHRLKQVSTSSLYSFTESCSCSCSTARGEFGGAMARARPREQATTQHAHLAATRRLASAPGPDRWPRTSEKCLTRRPAPSQLSSQGRALHPIPHLGNRFEHISAHDSRVVHGFSSRVVPRRPNLAWD
jgi:hypothetical protein